MRSNQEPLDDQAQARREHEARRLLLDHGADRLARRPWQPGPVPPSAVDLIQFFLWHASTTHARDQSSSPPGDQSSSPGDESSSTRDDIQGSTPDGLQGSARDDVRGSRRDGVQGSARDDVQRSTRDVVHDSMGGDVRKEAAVAALRLFPAARAELEQLEAGLMFEARGLGLTWAEMARALGLNSPQACQQRLDRLTARSSRPADGQAT